MNSTIKKIALIAVSIISLTFSSPAYINPVHAADQISPEQQRQAVQNEYNNTVQKAQKDREAADKQALEERNKKAQALFDERDRKAQELQKLEEQVNNEIKKNPDDTTINDAQRRLVEEKKNELKQYDANMQTQLKQLDAQQNQKNEANKQKYDTSVNQAKQTLNSNLEKVNWDAAINGDRDTFNVGLILRANDQKTYFDRAKESKKPIVIEIIDKITSFMLKLSIPLAVLGIIIGGYMMMFANGDDNMLQKGKETIKYVAMGLVIIFCSYLIVQFIISILFQTVV